MFTIKNASNFNLENYPYDKPVIKCTENGDLNTVGDVKYIGTGINQSGDIYKFAAVKLRNEHLYEFYRWDLHFIKLDENDDPEKYIVSTS